MSNVHILLQMDNTTAVAYVRNMGGTRSQSCDIVARDIWHWAIKQQIWLSATHIAGITNVLADSESRLFVDKSEWKLSSEAFHLCTQRWGLPDIDLFATRINNQLPRFASWRPDPEAIAIDAFTLIWEKQFIYCFPPFCLLSRVVAKANAEKCRAIIIAPAWPTQPWYSRLQHHARDIIKFHQHPSLLSLPGQPGQQHPLRDRLHLTAFLL